MRHVRSIQCVDRFFFSSRRRHTRSLCDWSSDVCSSDLTYSSRNVAYSFAVAWRNEGGICPLKGWVRVILVPLLRVLGDTPQPQQNLEHACRCEWILARHAPNAFAASVPAYGPPTCETNEDDAARQAFSRAHEFPGVHNGAQTV